jgi:hypothetical protein
MPAATGGATGSGGRSWELAIAGGATWAYRINAIGCARIIQV